MSDEDKTPVDEISPVDTPIDFGEFGPQRTPVRRVCSQCARELTWVKAGTGVPVREPELCLLARDGSWAFCAIERRGWVQLVYMATRPPFDKA